MHHRLLRKRAGELLQEWSFPYKEEVSRLTAEIAKRCVSASLEPNARLGAGANAYGIRAVEFERLPEESPDLARVLKFALAYNALTLVPGYSCKDELWCLLELGGLAIVHYGLTLQRGGFLEGDVSELARMLELGSGPSRGI